MITLEPRQAVTRTYAPLTGQDVPAKTREITPSPEQCNAVTWCDTIPFLLAGSRTGATVNVTMTSQGPANSDVDLYVYDDARNGSSTLITSDTGSSNPTDVTFAAESSRYKLVIVNGFGRNDGYTVRWIFDPKATADDTGSFDGDPVELNGARSTTAHAPAAGAGVTDTAGPTPAAGGASTGAADFANHSGGSTVKPLRRSLAVDRVRPRPSGTPTGAMAVLVLPMLLLATVLIRSRGRRP